MLFAIEAKQRQVEAGRLHGAGQQVTQIIAEPIEKSKESRERAGELLGVNQFVANRGSLRVPSSDNQKVAEAAQKRSSAWRPDYRPGHDHDHKDRNLAPGHRPCRLNVNQGGC